MPEITHSILDTLFPRSDQVAAAHRQRGAVGSRVHVFVTSEKRRLLERSKKIRYRSRYPGYDSNIEKLRAWEKENRDRLSAQKRRWAENNRDRVNRAAREYRARKRDARLSQRI